MTVLRAAAESGLHLVTTVLRWPPADAHRGHRPPEADVAVLPQAGRTTLSLLAERYCVVARTLAAQPHLTIRRAAGVHP